MFCPFCGNHLSLLLRFCISCGRSPPVLKDMDQTVTCRHYDIPPFRHGPQIVGMVTLIFLSNVPSFQDFFPPMVGMAVCFIFYKHSVIPTIPLAYLLFTIFIYYLLFIIYYIYLFINFIYIYINKFIYYLLLYYLAYLVFPLACFKRNSTTSQTNYNKLFSKSPEISNIKIQVLM